MKTKNLNFSYFILFVVFLPALLFLSLYTPPTKTAKADNEIVTGIDDVTDKNNYFTLKANPVSRGGTLQGTTQTITTETGEIKYYCFNWRDISSITFRFSSNLSGSKSIFTSYQFLVTSIQTENLETSIGQAKPQTLLSNSISSNTPVLPNIYYYFDNNSNTSDSQYKFSGNDFGIYKFDFNYTFIEDSSPDSPTHTFSIGELYIAILPDDIDTISISSLSLTYSVASSKELMNIYNVTFSNQNIFKFVNPKYIKWSVFGKDKKNVEYVLTKQIRDEGHPSCKYIWEALPTQMQEGSSFILDTNNIEGDWTVYCTVYNSDWTEKTKLSTGNLTTVKHREKSYIAMILGIVFGVIALIVIIILIVFWTRNKKKA